MQINPSSLRLQPPQTMFQTALAQARPQRTLGGGESSNDLAQFSPYAQQLSASGLDTSTSQVSRSASAFIFDLNYASSSLLKMNASGVYAAQSETLDLSFSFVFEREVQVDGHSQKQAFQASVSLSFSQIETASVTAFSRKENVMDLASRLIDDIWKTQVDPEKSLAGIVLDKEDFLDLSGVEDGKLLKELIALVQAIQFSSRLQELMQGESDKTPILLHPQRRRDEGLSIAQSTVQMSAFSLSIEALHEEGTQKWPEEIQGKNAAVDPAHHLA